MHNDNKHDRRICPNCMMRRLVSFVNIEVAFQAMRLDINTPDTLEERKRFVDFLASTGADGVIFARAQILDPVFNRSQWQTRVLN